MKQDELYERKDSLSRGRHLVATGNIGKGRIVFNERPLLSLQTIGNAHDGALVCRCCRAFIGGPDICLGITSGRINREELSNLCNKRSEDNNTTWKIIPCRNGCGELFCSNNCEEDMWNCCGHDFLCTGLIPDTEVNVEAETDSVRGSLRREEDGNDESDSHNELHPLLQFKMHALQNNEILLMIGDLIATVVSLYRKKLEAEMSNDLYSQTQPPSLERIMAPYLDFTLEPWWDVVTAPIRNDPMKKTEVLTLNKTLKDMCEISSGLLKRAFYSFSDAKYLQLKVLDLEKSSNIFASTLNQALEDCNKKYNIFSGSFFGKIIGSFEQNAIGIRARNPICRDVLEMKALRTRCHDDLVTCCEKVGMNNSEDDDFDTDIISEKETSLIGLKDEATTLKDDTSIGKNEHKYTTNDIARFIAGLHIDEDSNGRISSDHSEVFSESQSDDDVESCGCKQDGDDLDLLFMPFDGTAMYSTTCKMNHSCCPNIVAKYVFSCSSGGEGARWGENFPMTIQCVALRDIKEGEELCISYISNDQPFEQRQKELANYGFECECCLCLQEKKKKDTGNILKDASNNFEGVEDDIFGKNDEESEQDLFGQESEVDDDVSITIDTYDADGTYSGDSWEDILNKRVAKLDLLPRPSGIISLRIIVPASSFVLQVGKIALQNLGVKEKNNCKESTANAEILKYAASAAINAIKEKNFSSCIQMGNLGELNGFRLLTKLGTWPDASHRELYKCSAVAASVGYASNGSFLPALKMLDKASIFGLVRELLPEFFDYVESNAYDCYHSHTFDFRMPCTILPNYRESILRDKLCKEGLSSEIKFPINEVDIASLQVENFNELYEVASKPIVIRNFAQSWPALQRWRNMDYFIRHHGNRVVPVERGNMSEVTGMKEDLMSIRHFFTKFMIPSSSRVVWPLESTVNKTIGGEVAYLAQHDLFNQIPNLLDDIDSKPSLCGRSGPSHINIWAGTGGTKTPLHFDSFDNLFVQIVGAKYVRLYSQEETEKLYVLSKEGPSYSKQGNMSALDCEKEDFVGKHAKARDANFTEVLMLPGDLLFIPSKTWHYVRGLSTSISVNFWW